MKRVILRVVAMLLTFALGVTVTWLILWREVEEPDPPCKVELVSPEALVNRIESIASITPITPVATVPAPAATPKPHFILDYDPEMFNPYGMYYIMGPKPKEFASFDSFEVVLIGLADDPGYISVFTNSEKYNSDSTSAVFAFVTERRLAFATAPTVNSKVEYRFEGEFLRTDFDAVAGRNKAVLRGTLTRSKNGRKLVESTVTFRMEHHGC
ncbi:MAG TPA: hypothetical protein VF290_03320 [Pyrinomonadaceae bacterium]